MWENFTFMLTTVLNTTHHHPTRFCNTSISVFFSPIPSKVCYNTFKIIKNVVTNVIKHRLNIYKKCPNDYENYEALKKKRRFTSRRNITASSYGGEKCYFHVNVCFPFTAYCKPTHQYFPASTVRWIHTVTIKFTTPYLKIQ